MESLVGILGKEGSWLYLDPCMTVSTFPSFPQVRGISTVLFINLNKQKQIFFFLVDIWQCRGSQFLQALLCISACTCFAHTGCSNLWIGYIPEVHFIRISQLDQHATGLPGATEIPQGLSKLLHVCADHILSGQEVHCLQGILRGFFCKGFDSLMLETLFGNQLFGAFNA